MLMCEINGLNDYVQDYLEGVAISLDSWVGVVNSVSMKVLLCTKDGSTCTIPYKEAFKLVGVCEHDEVSRLKYSIEFLLNHQI